MADDTRITLAEMYHWTARLNDAAGETGDEFLQYLYSMVLIYLQDCISGDCRQEHTVELRDPQIQMAARLI